ncbi:MAG TPA: protoporphyrinogen oxidase [Actinomycetota bacterium]
MNPSSRPRRVAVIGGGVTGLTVAYRLVHQDAALEVTVYEGDARPGGKLCSVQVGSLTLPAGADSFLARKPWGVALCKELGVELEAPGTTGAHLWTETGLVPLPKDAPFGIPGDIGEVLRWPGVSSKGRRRAAQDLLRKKRKDGVEESLGGLLRRRLGDEATDRAVAPLLAGLYAGDVDRLSARATFPDLERWESWQGSLIRGAQAATRHSKRGDPGPMFVRPRGGVDRLIEAIAERLGPRVRTGSERATLEGLDADAVVVATSAGEAAGLLEGSAPVAAADLAGIPYASTGVVLMVYGEDTQRGLPKGTGFVVPRGEAPMTAATWLSSKWPDESFGTRAVVRSFVGAVGEQDILNADDDELVDACARHLTALVSLPDRPEHAAVVRWPASMPQYDVGHQGRVARIRASLPAGIFVVGQAYDGVGIPDCVRAAGETAAQVLAYLDDDAKPTPNDEETVR